MNNTKLILVTIATGLLAACATPKQPQIPVVSTPFVAPKKAPEPAVYNPSRTRVNDLVHTKLEVSFDYAKQYLIGKAWITVKPHFNPAFYLDLDAVGFDLKAVQLVTPTGNKPLKYVYEDGKVITVNLDRLYKKNEEYTVYVEYVAKPNELKVQGSAAINDAKGLYFINPLGKEKNKNKPTQIWTQGETQANSCWFPTIDSPNQRMTQDLYITCQNKYTTLSNGLLIESKDNGNGTRTDYWRQTLPAAPYLTMMTVGEFAVVKDKWRKLEVDYYVEKEYENQAQKIFGNTPEMMEFFSERLGVEYPWEKYSQVVVRDYVSGAMENTTAVLHGEFMQENDREMIDSDNEDVVSHELFHHWFGDLVTCESWANLPLNESFATYGEYLWREHKYGTDNADQALQGFLQKYLASANTKNPDLVRFDYSDKEEMFDAVTYEKGGRVLHMLRKYVGDDAFFAALKLYLTKHKYTAVEVHDLRLAFEEVTGEDLNWFFNEWFYNHGHPDLFIRRRYNDTTGKEIIYINQVQDFSKNPLFKLPIDIDFYRDGRVERRRVVVTKANEKIEIAMDKKPDLVNIDGDKSLLCTKNDERMPAEMAFQYYNAPLYLDRYEAVTDLCKPEKPGEKATDVIMDALNDKYWNIKVLAIKNIAKFIQFKKEPIRQKLMTLAKDPKSTVRAEAIKALAKNYTGEDLIALYKTGVNDPSYKVMTEALLALGGKKADDAMKIAKSLETDHSKGTAMAIVQLYSDKGGEEQAAYFKEAINYVNGGEQYAFMQNYSKFLKKSTDKTILDAMPTLEYVARNGTQWFVRLSAVQAMSDLSDKYGKDIKEIQDKIAANKVAKKDAENPKLEADISDINKRKAPIDERVAAIKRDETDPNLKQIYGTATAQE